MGSACGAWGRGVGVLGGAAKAESAGNSRTERVAMEFTGKLIGREKEERGRGQPVADSQNEKRDGVENDEIYLVVVTVYAGTRRFRRKISPKSSPET